MNAPRVSLSLYYPQTPPPPSSRAISHLIMHHMRQETRNIVSQPVHVFVAFEKCSGYLPGYVSSFMLKQGSIRLDLGSVIPSCLGASTI